MRKELENDKSEDTIEFERMGCLDFGKYKTWLGQICLCMFCQSQSTDCVKKKSVKSVKSRNTV